MPSTHVVSSGETLSQISRRHGFSDWNVVWKDPGNDAIRSLRSQPEQIRPGDKIHVPDRNPVRTPVTPCSTTCLKLKSPGQLAVFELGVFDKANPSRPLAGFDVHLRIPSDGSIQKYVTPADGVIRLEGPTVASGSVEVVVIEDLKGNPPIRYSAYCGQSLPVGESHVIEIPDKRSVADAIAAEQGMTRRSGWGARSPKKELEPDWDYAWIVIHHSGDGGYKTAKALQDVQMDKRSYDDIAYEYVVQLDGSVYEGRHISYKSAANSKQNTGKIGIIIAGDFEHQIYDVDDDVTQASLDRVVSLVNTLKKHFPLTRLVGHRDLDPSNECPGSELYPRLEELRKKTGLAGL